MSTPINAGMARLSLAAAGNNEEGARKPFPAAAQPMEAERPSSSFISRRDLALASLAHANIADMEPVRQAILDYRFFARDGTRLNLGWTIQDSNLECNHPGPWTDFRGQRVPLPRPVYYNQMFDEEGVLLCEDGRSGEKCRVWHPGFFTATSAIPMSAESARSSIKSQSTTPSTASVLQRRREMRSVPASVRITLWLRSSLRIS
ncbi:unnamed protein product [Aureobasidium uvarum]|uniref:Uncharacterized protein n=1 Tax=Aureobasidium uvarum TaxID=2773716 RepID=A0A9N8KIF8_9PEZI|nr:unnamed protein product [Aureobasidium uvarum]